MRLWVERRQTCSSSSPSDVVISAITRRPVSHFGWGLFVSINWGSRVLWVKKKILGKEKKNTLEKFTTLVLLGSRFLLWGQQRLYDKLLHIRRCRRWLTGFFLFFLSAFSGVFRHLCRAAEWTLQALFQSCWKVFKHLNVLWVNLLWDGNRDEAMQERLQGFGVKCNYSDKITISLQIHHQQNT